MGMKLTKESIKFVLNSAICIEMSKPTRLHVLPLQTLLIKLNRFVWCFNFFSIILCYFHGTMKNLGWHVVAHSKYRTIVLPFEIFKLILSTGNIELALWMLPMSTFLIFVSRSNEAERDGKIRKTNKALKQAGGIPKMYRRTNMQTQTVYKGKWPGHERRSLWELNYIVERTLKS